MTIAWIGSSLTISLLLGGVALLLEILLRRWEGATRGLWASALFLSAVLPLALLGWQDEIVRVWSDSNMWVSDRTGIPLFGLQLFLIRLQFLAGLHLPDVTTLLRGTWLLTVCVVSLWLAYSWWDLVSRRTSWERGTFEGLDCYFTEHTGPGLAGMLRTFLVVPRWIRGLDAKKREIVAVHEREHQRCRDPWLMTFGYASLLLTPWNPILWWQRSRLQLAMEMDCDRRTVRETGDPIAYGEGLLEIAERKSRWVTAFSQSESYLLQRIRHLKGELRPTGPRALGAGLATAIMLTLVWAAPMPVSPPPRPATVDSVSQVLSSPSPWTTQPRCLNCGSAGPGDAGEASPLPRRALIYIDRSGQVVGAVCRPLCSEALEERLLARMAERTYAPASIWGIAVPTWYLATVRSSGGRDRGV